LMRLFPSRPCMLQCSAKNNDQAIAHQMQLNSIVNLYAEGEAAWN
jgi:hypothetical protein